MKTIFNTPPWAPARERRQQKVDPKRMREVNSEELLRLLRVHSPCSRADLVRSSGLTAPTVSAAIASLQRRGLIKVLGDGASSGGRPPSLLEFNSQAGYIVGVDIGGSAVRLALADLGGKIQQRWNIPLQTDRTPNFVVNAISAGVGELLRQASISDKKVLAIAAGAPGITDVRSGRVLAPESLQVAGCATPRHAAREDTPSSHGRE